jgi:hypothetical protein
MDGQNLSLINFVARSCLTFEKSPKCNQQMKTNLHYIGRRNNPSVLILSNDRRNGLHQGSLKSP